MLLLQAAVVCTAQQPGNEKKDPVKPEIRGVLVEAGVLQPISDADVSYWKMPGKGELLDFSDDRALGRTKTGADGGFRFTPDQFGEYYVLAKKEGYFNANSAGQGLSYAATVLLSSDRPTAEARLSVARPPRPTDRTWFWCDGRYSADLWPLTTATGDAGGKYQFTGVAPGEYRILAVPSALKDKLEMPNVLEPLLRTTKQIELGPRVTQNLALELTELR